MDNKMKILVCLGASVAANCTSCFNHYYAKAKAESVEPEEIKAAIDLARQVNRGAHIALMKAVEEATSSEGCTPSGCRTTDGPSCCG